jgi:hypothetical protein
MTISNFEKSNLKVIREDVDAALKAVGDKYGISLHLGNIRFDQKTFSGKLEATINDSKTGAAKSAMEIALEQGGKLYIGNNFEISKTYDYRGKKIKFVGLMPKKHKYPIVFQYTDSGKQYLMSSDDARKIVDPSYKPW